MKKALIILSAIAMLMLLVACGEVATSSNESESAAPASETVEEPAESKAVEQPTESEPVVEEPAEPELTMGQQQAIGKGEDYLDFASFSRQGLIDQLVFEGFSTEDATFAVDHIAPDWNAQAAQKAQDYLDMSSFSRQGLIDQLVFEGFTQAEAEYGVQAVGY